MPDRKHWFRILAVVAAGALVSCGELGRVEQGLVIDYDAARGLVTLITDSNPGGEPRYDVLPPSVVRTPQDRKQMGPEPAAGRLLELDTEAGRMVVYDEAASALKTVQFSLVEKADGVYPDDARVRETDLPIMNADNSSVTLYSPRTRELVTVTVPPEALTLPAECWRSGDEVRYYFKNASQALRMMNVTTTGDS